MNRLFAIVFAPEVVLAIFTGLVFAYCARHNSYSTEDVGILERFLWLLPLMVVPLAFATILGPGGKTWQWLARVNVAVVICLVVCGLRIVNGFGAPGSGPKGQDAGMILVVSLGVVLCAIANAIGGTSVLRAQKPAINEWFVQHPVGGTALAAASAIPLVVAQLIVTAVVLGFVAAVVSACSR